MNQLHEFFTTQSGCHRALLHKAGDLTTVRATHPCSHSLWSVTPSLRKVRVHTESQTQGMTGYRNREDP